MHARRVQALLQMVPVSNVVEDPRADAVIVQESVASRRRAIARDPLTLCFQRSEQIHCRSAVRLDALSKGVVRRLREKLPSLLFLEPTCHVGAAPGRRTLNARMNSDRAAVHFQVRYVE